MYKHIIWDFDGTLFDSYPIMAERFQKALGERGVDASIDEIMHFMTLSMADAMEHYAHFTPIDADFLAHYRELRSEKEKTSLGPFDGAQKLCRAIAHGGMYNYVFTHRGKSTYMYLAKYDMIGDFRDVVTSADGFARKPAPDAITHLMEKYGMRPREVLMIGDRPLDVLSAKNAGVDGCFITRYGACPEAKYTIQDLCELFLILRIDPAFAEESRIV